MSHVRLRARATLPRPLLLGVMCLALATTACGAQSASSAAGGGVASPTPEAGGGDATVTATPPATSQASVSATPAVRWAPPKVAGLSWRPQGRRVHGTSVTYVASTSTGRISLLWMDTSRLHFRLITGGQVPEGASPIAADDNPATWVGTMAAAFNGGFWLRDHAGGFYYGHRVVRRLLDGFASVVITSSGALHVEVWKSGMPLTGVATVRQNLEPVIVNHRITPEGSASSGGWAVPSHGSFVANRSALAELDDGSLIYVFGYHITPMAMARSLVSVGAKTAMMLDMNGSWPMAFTYSGDRSVNGTRVNSHEYHDASIYLRRYRKDFVVASV